MLGRLTAGTRRFLALALEDVIRLQMPALSPTMTSGSVGTWHKKIGDKINPGDALVSVETDKAVVEYEAAEEGYLAAIYVNSGTSNVKCGELIALMVEDESQLPEAAALPKPDSEPRPAHSSEEKSQPAISSKRLPFAMPAAAVRLTPLNVDLGSVHASGPGGRILKHDAVEFLKSYSPPKAGQRQQSLSASIMQKTQVPETRSIAERLGRGIDRDSPEAFTDIKVTTMRRVIAERLSDSKATVPHAYASAVCALDTLASLRSALKSKGEASSINDFVIRASALALRDVPVLNSVYENGKARTCDDVDISVAVATEGGLITPIVKNADQLSVASISKTVRQLAGKARANKLKPEEFQGGSFTVSNLGMFGISSFSAIINKPQTCILAVSSAESRPSVGPVGALVSSSTMTVTLSYDRRVVNESAAGQWLNAFKSYIEQPGTMA